MGRALAQCLNCDHRHVIPEKPCDWRGLGAKLTRAKPNESMSHE